ncbi:EAL domain-containing protein [Glaciecola sp. SC05]|uniref:sensor domain-containing phosphodiesterase n=1 Tax=Glaciecola sp. SC05 TaxID=1987355 RepID=UPI003528CAC2
MISFIALIFATSIGVNLLAAIIIAFSGIRLQKTHFTTIAIGCALAIFYQFSAWQYHSSAVLESALYWSTLQTSAVLASVPVYFLIFAQWSKYPNAIFIGSLLAAISSIFMLVNWSMDFGLRFSSAPELISYTIFNNETLYRLSGEASLAMSGFHVFGCLVLTTLVFIVRRLLKRGQRVVAYILLTTLVLQLAATLVSLLMQLQYINFIYLSGLPFTMLNVLACITIAISLKKRSVSLLKVVQKSENLERVLFSLAKGTQGSESSQYYQDILLEIQRLSGADMAYLAVLEKVNDKRYMQTKAAVYHQKPISNFSYSLDEIPEDLISEQEMVIVKHSVHERFPDIELFTNLQAQAFIGAPLITTDSTLEGGIVLIYSRPIEPDETLLKTLRVFASRAATECLRDKLEVDLRLMAYSDFKTQLPNLTSFNEEVKQRALFNAFNKQQSGLIILDLDRFGQVNLQFGFENAEFVLKTIAERFKQYAKDNIDSIYVARTGGDEFGFLINTVDPDCSKEIEKHWHAISELAQQPIKTEFSDIRLKCSAGAVVFPKQTTEKMIASRCAEFAMREAKKAGRNQLKFFDMQILEVIYRKQQLEKSLEIALLDKAELFLVYQPKVDSKGKLLGLEALCRWQSEEHGFISPLEFIEIAEASGQIHRLGLWCIEQVCRQINSWKEVGYSPNGRIAINISAKQLESEKFIEQIICILDQAQVKPNQIDLELTESGLLKNVHDSIQKLSALRGLGFSVSLDDFGTGYSSLSYLKDLPLDCIKIDRCFVNELDAGSSNLVQSIIAIGQHMHLDICAEGVEEQSQVKLLQEMGCNIFQGFYFSKPLSADDLPSYRFKQ